MIKRYLSTYTSFQLTPVFLSIIVPRSKKPFKEKRRTIENDGTLTSQGGFTVISGISAYRGCAVVNKRSLDSIDYNQNKFYSIYVDFLNKLMCNDVIFI